MYTKIISHNTCNYHQIDSLHQIRERQLYFGVTGI